MGQSLLQNGLCQRGKVSGNGSYDGGKRRIIHEELVRTQMLLSDYGRGIGFVSETSHAHIIFYYGLLSLPPPLAISGDDLDEHFQFPVREAIEFVNGASYGNMACLFTSSGASARRFRSLALAGNIGINIGVAAPMAQFPFSGWKESFFGDLHGQGRHAIEFFTQTKVVVERWPSEWSRKF